MLKPSLEGAGLGYPWRQEAALDGNKSLTAFHCHAGVASHQLLRELPSSPAQTYSCSPLHPSLWQQQWLCCFPGGPRQPRVPGVLTEEVLFGGSWKVKEVKHFMQIHSVFLGLPWVGQSEPVTILSPWLCCKRSSKSRDEPWGRGRALGSAARLAPDILISRRVF